MQTSDSAALLQLERIGAVLSVTMARAPVNALNDAMVAQLNGALDMAVADQSIALLHIRSNQRVFSAGADLAAIQACFATPEGPDAMTEVVRGMQRLYARLEAAPLVTLAEIGATALGGGLELALACDLRVAASNAQLGLTEARLGLLPGAGGTQRLTRLCGPGVATRMILGAELIDGAQAERLGIVHWAQPPDLLADFSAALAQRYAALPRAALAACKRCISAATERTGDGYERELSETRLLYDNPQTRATVTAFLSRKTTHNPKEAR